MPRSIARSSFLIAVLAIELVDEFVDGAGGAAWPLLRADLRLSYAEIGLLLTVPRIVGSLLEPALALMADSRLRRLLVLGGGIAFCASLLLAGVTGGFAALLAAFVLFNPASGTFVSLSQASLADADPAGVEGNMARWAFAGSLGNVLGPPLVGLALALGGNWRSVYLVLAGVAAVALAGAWRAPAAVSQHDAEESGFRDTLRVALQALQSGRVLRWLLLLEFTDLMLDVLRGLVALYFVDVLHAGEIGGVRAVAVLTGVGLLGDLLVIPLLARVPGLAYLRLSARVMLLLFPAFLLVPPEWKLALLGAIGILNAGWYAILKAQLFAALPGRSGVALALDNLTGLAGSLVPLLLGLVADRYGLNAAMWLLLAGPLALVVGLPRALHPKESGEPAFTR